LARIAGLALRAALVIAGCHLPVSAGPRPDHDPAACRTPPEQGPPAAIGRETPRTRFAAESLAAGFGLQYWGEGYDPDSLSSAPHGILIIEPARASGVATPSGREVWFTAAEVARITRNGARPVLVSIPEQKGSARRWNSAQTAAFGVRLGACAPTHS
jgi:hypothetical protein